MCIRLLRLQCLYVLLVTNKKNYKNKKNIVFSIKETSIHREEHAFCSEILGVPMLVQSMLMFINNTITITNMTWLSTTIILFITQNYLL